MHKAVSFQVKNSYSIEKEDDEDGTDITRQHFGPAGNLQILSGRNLATRVMSNGVEVIVKGDKTDYIVGLERTPSYTPRIRAKHTTLPPSTVSRQFHLVEQPGKPYQQINHLLHSIVRSASPDLITKTLVTTFTYMTTLLSHSSTVVNTREQVISNVVTEKFKPTALYTANLKAEPSSIVPLEDDSSYVTNTLMTTYTYYNAFTAGTVPIVLTSKETVSNILTVPAYLASPTLTPFSSRVFETETYFTTFTFSKTLADEASRVVTTMETITQVVVTEALVPAPSPSPTPLETKFTTFTFYTTGLSGSSPVLKSSTKVLTQVVTPTLVTPSLTVDVHPTLRPPQSTIEFVPISTKAQTISVTPTTIKPYQPPPVLIFATKTYYTTFTYFTTVLGEGSATKVHSRVQVASKIVTEALSTRLGTDYLAALKSSYLAKHSTMLHVSSTVKEIIPAKTESVTLMSPTLVTQSISYPHYPKDEDLPGYLDPTTPTAGSAEHYEELKEGISHIVSVLADSQEEPAYELVAPSTVEPLFSTIIAPTVVHHLPHQSMEILDDDELELTTESSMEYPNEISHRPTPPLKSSSVDRPFDDHLFTMVTGPPVGPIHYEEYEPSPESKQASNSSEGSGSVEESQLLFSHDQKVSLSIDSLESGLILTPSILNKIDIKGPPDDSKQIIPRPSDLYVTKIPANRIKPTASVDRTQQIFNMISDLTSQDNLPDYYDELKEEDAFAENFSEESTTKKVYSLNPNVTPMTIKVKAKPTKLRPRPSTMPPTTPAAAVFFIEREMTTEPSTFAPLTTTSAPSTVPIQTTSEVTTNKPTTFGLEVNQEDEVTAFTDESSTTKMTTKETTKMTTKDTTKMTTKMTTQMTTRTTTPEPPFAVKVESFENLDPYGQSHRITTAETLFPDIGKVVIRLTSPNPEPTTPTPTRRTTRRPQNNKRWTTKRPKPTHASDLDQKIYNIAHLEDTDESVSDEDSKEEDNTDNDNKSDEADESDEVADVHPEEDIAHDHSAPSGPGPIASPPIGHHGAPSKSNIGPGVVLNGGSTGSQILSASSNGINWTPLLNLGALGLGGLGASTLTKLGPLWHSVAGYMKSALPLAGIARNDTHHKGKPMSIDEHTLYHHPMGPNFVRVNSNGSPTVLLENAPSRPILPMGAEPNYKPPPITAPNSYQQYAAGTNNFPPNNYNFAPPHDNQPNMFAEFPQISHPPRSSEVLHNPYYGSNLIPNKNFPQGSGTENRPNLPQPPTSQGSLSAPHSTAGTKLTNKEKLEQILMNRPYEILPAVLDSDELSSYEVNDPSAPSSSPQSPTAPELSSKPPGNIKDIINSVTPTKTTIVRNDKPAQLHHMDKVYYNNVELLGGNDNPFLTISVEKPPPTGNSANQPVRISFSSPGGNSGPVIHQHQPSPSHPSMFDHAESMEHDAFIPPPRFPPPDSMSYIPTPPPMARPTRMPINRGPSVPSPPGTSNQRPNSSKERLPKIPFPSQSRPPFIPLMNENIWTRLNGSATSNENQGPFLNMGQFGSNRPGNVPQASEPNRFMVPPNRAQIPNSLPHLPQKPNPFNVPSNRRPIGPLKTSQEHLFRPIPGPAQGSRPMEGSGPRPQGSTQEQQNQPFRPMSSSNEQQNGPFRPMASSQEVQIRPFKPISWADRFPRPPSGSQEQSSFPQRRPGGSSEKFNGPIGPPTNSQENRPSSSERPKTSQERPNGPYGSNERPNSPYGSNERPNGPYGSNERPNGPYGSNERPNGPYGSQERPGPLGPPRNSQEQFNLGPMRPPITPNDKLRPPVLLPAVPMKPFNPQRRPIGPPMTSGEQIKSVELNHHQSSSSQEQRNPDEFGNSAQAYSPHPVLLPGFQQIPWGNPTQKPPSSQEKPSSLENHRLPTGFVRPMRPTGTIVRVPSTQTSPPTTSTPPASKLIIKEITPVRTPIGGFRNISATTSPAEITKPPPNRATISKLNFVRRFTTRPPATTPANSTNFGQVNSFIISPTVPEVMDDKIDKDGSNGGGKYANLFPKRPQLNRFPFRSTTRKPFDVSKHFTNMNETGGDETGVAASEDAHVIVDPAGEQIMSPFDKVDPISFNRATSTVKPKDDPLTSSEEIDVQEDRLLEKLKQAGFPFATPKEFDELWWPTTFKPFPTFKVNKGSSTEKVKDLLDSPTTFRNVMKPTTFRPNGTLVSSELVRNQLTRPGSSQVQYNDEDSVGMEDIKIKNVEIHKIPSFVKKPTADGPTSSEKDSEYYDESYEEVEVKKEKPNNKPSEEAIGEGTVSIESHELPKPQPPPPKSTERPAEDEGNETGNTFVPMPATALTPPAPPPNYLDPNNPRVRPPVGAIVHYSPNGPNPNDILRRPTDGRLDVIQRPQPPQIVQQNILRHQFQPTLATDLHPPAPHGPVNGFHFQDGSPVNFNGRPLPPSQGGRPGLIRRPIHPQRRPDFMPEIRPEFGPVPVRRPDGPSGPPQRPDENRLELPRAPEPPRRPDVQEGRPEGRPEPPPNSNQGRPEDSKFNERRPGLHNLQNGRPENRPGVPYLHEGRPEIFQIGPDGRPRQPIRRPLPPRGNQPASEGPGPVRQGPIRRPASNRPPNELQRPQGPIRRPNGSPFSRNPFLRRPTTTQETTTESTSTRRPSIRTSTKQPLDSQEYSEEEEEETESNEILVDNMKSTTENENIVVVNQHKSSNDETLGSSTNQPVAVKDSEEYSDEIQETPNRPSRPINEEKNTEKLNPPAEESAKNTVEHPGPFLRRPIHAGGHLNHFQRRPVQLRPSQRPLRPENDENNGPQDHIVRRPTLDNSPEDSPRDQVIRRPPQFRPASGEFRPNQPPRGPIRRPQNSQEASASSEDIDPQRDHIRRPFDGRPLPGRTRQPIRPPPGRPNLLRPHTDVFKPEPSPSPVQITTVHTIASVDHDNKIIGTNVFTAILHSSHELQKSKVSEIQPSGSLNTEQLLATPTLDEGESTLSPTSVVKYSSGTLQTVSSYDLTTKIAPSESDEYSEEYEDDDDDNDVRPPVLKSSTRTVIRTRVKPTPSLDLTSPALTAPVTSVTSEISTATSTSRFVFPTRKPFTRPPLVKDTTEVEETTVSESKTVTSRRPFAPTRNSTVTPPWLRRRGSTTTTEHPEVTEESKIVNETRRFPPRKPFVPFTTTPRTTTEEPEAPKARLTTFRPFRKPGTFAARNTTTTSTSTTPEPETSDEDDSNEIKASDTPVTDPEDDDGDDEDQKLNQDETKIVSHVQTSVNFKINPSRVLHRGRPRGTTADPKYDDDTNTRFVTHTETQTQTITETERTVMTSQGQPVTHTVMITKTLPPQTLISTIVGTVTVVNSVEVKPTTVRTTIYTEPTIIIPAPPVDPTERSPKERPDGSAIPISRGSVVLKGPPSSTPTASLTTEESIEKGKVGPPELECISNCSHEKNQVCRRYANGTRSHCVCKPGYARLKSTIPCKPAFTYELSMRLSNMDEMDLNLRDLRSEASDDYQNFIKTAKEGLDKTFMKTDVRTKFMGSEVMKVIPKKFKDLTKNVSESEVNMAFLVQLSLNVTEDLIKQQFVRQLKSSNFTIGSGNLGSSSNMSHYAARDFDECSHADYNDCSKNADCINIKGSFTCKCRHGFLDRSRKESPGRDCRVTDGCPECSYQGKCVIDPFGNPACNCFRWFGGSQCQVNLKVLLISIIVIGFVLFILVLLCGIVMCRRKKPPPRERTGSGRFLRYRSPTSQATLDRAAIMNDSGSSDGSQTPTVRVNPLPCSFTPDSLLVDTVEKNFMRESRENVNLMNFSLRNVLMEQQDRSLTVVIPRAKIRPASRPSSRPTQSSLPPVPSDEMGASEQKLLRYLEQGPAHVHSHGAPGSSRPPTTASNPKSFRKLSLQEQRKISSGALVSSGTEVSAQGGMRRRSTGLPIHEHEPPLRHEPEFRSFDQSYRPGQKSELGASRGSVNSYRCKPPSYCGYSESHGHTMNEKDGASTVYTTQGKLFRMTADYDSNSLSD